MSPPGVADRVREHIVGMCAGPEGGHLGGSLSLVEILTTLYFGVLRVDPESKYFHHLIEKLMAVDDRQLRAISAGSFFYAALVLTEGVGLMLEVRDLHTYYGGIAALRGISFDVPRGSVIALVGANGAGKSTTLNTISGLLAPRSGRT